MFVPASSRHHQMSREDTKVGISGPLKSRPRTTQAYSRAVLLSACSSVSHTAGSDPNKVTDQGSHLVVINETRHGENFRRARGVRWLSRQPMTNKTVRTPLVAPDAPPSNKVTILHDPYRRFRVVFASGPASPDSAEATRPSNHRLRRSAIRSPNLRTGITSAGKWPPSAEGLSRSVDNRGR
jgi:hypothetical protein